MSDNDEDDYDAVCARCRAPLDTERRNRIATYCAVCEALDEMESSDDSTGPLVVPSSTDLLKQQQSHTATDHDRTMRGTSGLD